jgi:hypothetical protein
MTEIAPPLFDEGTGKASSRIGPEIRRLWRYVAAAFSIRERESISRSLYARLTGVLAASMALVLGVVALLLTVGSGAMKGDNDNLGHLTGMGFISLLVVAVLVLWIGFRQRSLVRARFRTVGRTVWDRGTFFGRSFRHVEEQSIYVAREMVTLMIVLALPLDLVRILSVPVWSPIKALTLRDSSSRGPLSEETLERVEELMEQMKRKYS